VDERDREHMELRAVGWEPVERGGVAIWQCPDHGFYYSQDVAVELVREGTKPYVPKCLGEGAA
jgi:hypothetical protein